MNKDLKIFKMINDLLEYKLEFLNQIYELTILQCEKIEEDNIEKLLNIINSKQIRIEKIKNIDIRYSNILNQYGAKKFSELGFDYDSLSMLEDKESRIRELATKIHEIEQSNQHILRGKFELVKGKLKAFKKGKKVTSSYYQVPTQANGYFIDSRK